MNSTQDVCLKTWRGIFRAVPSVRGFRGHVASRDSRRGNLSLVAGICAALLIAPAARAVDVVAQNGISYTGTVSATALGDVIGMTANSGFPGTTTIGDFAFRGAITVGTDLWLLPTDSDEIVVVDTTTGTMTGYGLIGVGTTVNKFAGGVYDGTFIWLVPFNANGVLRVRVADGGGGLKGDVNLFDSFPAGITAGDAGKFAGGVYANGYVWFVPHNADSVVRLDPSDGSMVEFNTWPGTFTKGAQAFWGGVYDGTNLWMVPFDADRIVKVDPTDGSMTEVATTHWTNDLTNFTLPSRAFAGGTWDGTSVWLVPYDADRIVSIATASDTMTGYGSADDATQWPAGFTKSATGASFNGGIYDSDDVWLVPFEADHVIKVDTATGVMTGYTNFPSSVASSDVDKFAGAGFDGTDIYLVPATRSGQTLVKVFATATAAVQSINRLTPLATETNADTVVFRVSFNTTVVNVDTTDFTLTTSGTAAGTIDSVSAATGTTIDVTVTSVSGDGALRLDVDGSTDIQDQFTNGISGFSSGQIYTIDNTAPVITSALAASGSYRTMMTYTITSTGGASSFGATGLPAGLSIDSGSGVISGEPTVVGGPTNVTISAIDAAGNADMETLTVTIDPATLTVSGITASDKVYDATVVASLGTSAATLVGVFSGDVVTFDTTAAAGAFADKNVGTGKTVNISGLTIGGADVAKYTLTQPSTTATIDNAALTITGVTASDKIYDSTTAATVDFGSAVLVGVLGSDTVALVTGGGTGTFNTATVGAGKPVAISGLTLNGADAGNYAITQPATTASITAASVTVSGITAADKVYDGTTAAILDTSGASLSGVVGGDTATLDASAASGTFADKNVGAGKTVSITGLAITGTDGGNYVVSTTVDTADITAKNLTVSGVAVESKAFDGTTDATLDLSGAALVGVVSGDSVTLDSGSASASFADETVGAGKTVTVTGLVLAGDDAGNYTLAQPSITGTITKASATVTITDTVRIFDGTAVPVTVTTSPEGLTVNVTYDGSATVPSAIGSYAVEAVVDDDSYAGTGSATLTIQANSRMVNLSARAQVGTGNDILIPGFVISGTGTKTVLIRGIGPALEDFGVGGALAAPTITLYSDSDVIDSNTGWSTASNAGDIETTAATVGAFPLTADSPDSALLATLAPGRYTVHLSGLGATTGVGLVEVYDADPDGSTARLVNISARAQVGTGADILIPGVVVGGNGPRQLLVRAVGPGLTTFGVTDFLANPMLRVFKGGDEVASNDDWEDNANADEIVTKAGTVGAFPLENGSMDAAVLITLEPGAYTVQVTGVGATAGVALVELFEVP